MLGSSKLSLLFHACNDNNNKGFIMRNENKSISLGIIGAGSCASSLAQVIYLNKEILR
jgi:hypothetical protein